jgi:SagB-type dehydrogenase family enzyme
MHSDMGHTRAPTFASPRPRARWLKLAAFEYPLAQASYLDRPKAIPRQSFVSVLLARRTRRKFLHLPDERLATLLWFAVKTRAVGVHNSTVIHQFRSAPASGAVHAVDILVLRRIRGRWDAFLYDPGAHALVEILVLRNQLAALLREVEKNLRIGAATVLWMVGDLNRLRARYVNEQSLIWRDAGALLATICLTAEALRIAACPLGSLAEPHVTRMLGGEGKVLSLGGLLVGRRAR